MPAGIGGSLVALNVVLAICVSLLAITGIARTYAGKGRPSEKSGSSSWLDFILLPYTATGIAMLLVVLLLYLRKAVSGSQRFLRRPEGQLRLESPARPSAGGMHGERGRPIGLGKP